MKALLKNKYILVGVALFMGGLIGWVIKPSDLGKSSSPVQSQSTRLKVHQEWTCSMHPQIRQPEEGDCPICGMDLIPVSSEMDGGGNSIQIKMSPIAVKLANIQTALVSKNQLVKELRLNGKVKADERNIFSQTSHIAGRLEKMQVSFTGENIKKGQVIAYVYSPELVTAQEELFEAWKVRESQPTLYNSARKRLLNWKLEESQIDDLISKGKVKEQFPIKADVTGVVTSKLAKLGDYVSKGQPLFEITNLSKVWVLFDVYESDIAWVKKGNSIDFSIASLPGKTFAGKITFVDPMIDPNTRVATARVEISNNGMELKPEMFANGVLKANIPSESEIITVPKSAVIWTGKRSIVYVKKDSEKGMNFEMREVTIGQSLGETYAVNNGLEEGEEIAINGAFNIDAAAQLAGKPSMMNQVSEEHLFLSADMMTAPSKATIEEFLKIYFKLKTALVKDDFDTANEESKQLVVFFKQMEITLLDKKGEEAWKKHKIHLKQSLAHFGHSNDIEALREQFISVSEDMINLIKSVNPTEQIIYIQHCPMADNNKGANWLSLEKEIRNPYFGASMLMCGEVTGTVGY